MRTILPVGLMVILVVGLGACGVRTELKPATGKQLPVAPYGQTNRPGAAELLSPGAQARPGRNVELRQKSEPRGDDPFDLPPKK